MPTTRKRKGHPSIIQPEFDAASELHLAIGDCLLGGFMNEACFCGLRREGGVLDEEAARKMWQEHKEEILRVWNKPGQLCWAEELFGK